MPVHLTMLASGSRGNAALIRAGGAGMLIDLGLGGRDLGARLEAVGSDWDRVACALLTHTHGDHVRDASLFALARRKATLWCHEGHRGPLGRHRGWQALERLGLVRHYDDRPFLTALGHRVEPIRLAHDGGPTYGFRVEARAGAREPCGTVGYVADTGHWTGTIADALTDVGALAVEFNHDVDLQRRSGRPWHLIARNLGDRGHLSNDQGAALVADVLARSRPRAVQHVVLLHLSEQCNRPGLAVAAARAALRASGVRAVVHAAAQAVPSPHVELAPRRLRGVATGRAAQATFPWEAA
jgi:phosphoribosyl 1,2-cyclic phosphodiesterase